MGSQVARQVRLGDGLAGSQGAIAEHQVGFASEYPRYLASEGFEEGRRTHDAVAQAGSGQGLFKGKLGPLELELRALYADRREEHEVGDAGLARHGKERQVGAVFDRPGILDAATAGGEAGKDRIEAFTRETGLAQAVRIGAIADPQLGARQRRGEFCRAFALPRAAARTYQADDPVAAITELPDQGATDVAACPRDEDRRHRWPPEAR
jgi:hypothetical protein